MSNAHGWGPLMLADFFLTQALHHRVLSPAATGPTPALSFFVLGVRPVSPTLYLVAPQPSGLQFAEGQLALDAQQSIVAVQWRVAAQQFYLRVDARRANSIGCLAVPSALNGAILVSVFVNDELVWSVSAGRAPRSGGGLGEADQDSLEGYWYLRHVSPAIVHIVATYA